MLLQQQLQQVGATRFSFSRGQWSSKSSKTATVVTMVAIARSDEPVGRSYRSPGLDSSPAENGRERAIRTRWSEWTRPASQRSRLVALLDRRGPLKSPWPRRRRSTVGCNCARNCVAAALLHHLERNEKRTLRRSNRLYCF